MRKLLQINTYGNWGSTGKITEQIGECAKANGWDSYIACDRKITTSNSKIIKIGGTIPRLFHVLCSRIFDAQGLCSKISTKLLIRRIRSINPDVIHLHNLHGYYLNYPILFKYLNESRIPIVWTLHDCWGLTGHCTHFTSIQCYKWKSLCFNCPIIHTYPKSYTDFSRRNYQLKKICFSNTHNLNIVVVSEWLKNIVAQSYLKRVSTQTIYNGIDLEDFRPRKTNLREKYNIDKGLKIVLGVASKWEERKGLRDFLLLSELLSKDYVIVLVGVNDKQIRSLSPKIIGISHINSAHELSEFYSEALVYFNSSTEETLGMTTIESLACGTPAIVYDSTACAEPIISGVGYVIQPHDIEVVKQTIEMIAREGKIKYSEACRNHALTNFDKRKSYNEYINLYTRLVSK